MEKLVIALVVGVFLVAVAVLQAQVVVWALSLYHVNSGLLAPWLLLVVAETVAASAVTQGIRTAAKD